MTKSMSGQALTSYSDEYEHYDLLYSWHSVHIQMKTCLFAIQSPRGYTHSNTVLCLYPSPQASKLCVWRGAQGDRVITSVKQTSQGETRLSALEGVVNDESWYSDTVMGGCLSLMLAHRHPLSYITDHMISSMTAWLVTNEECGKIIYGCWKKVKRGHDVTMWSEFSLWEWEEASDGQWLLEIDRDPLEEDILMYCRYPYWILDHFTAYSKMGLYCCLRYMP